MQVQVTGYNPEIHILTCNGRRLPLQLASDGSYVAGVRFRAWQPSSALHPTIGIHAPLHFDLVLRAEGRSLGGCVYHVAHPGGRNYETTPVNSAEAEGRRLARFWDWGHTPATLHSPGGWTGHLGVKQEVKPAPSKGVLSKIPPAEPINQEYPLTLDLRRSPF